MNCGQDPYRVNRDILKIYEFDRVPSPVSPFNSSFNNSLFLILSPLTIQTPSPAVTFNLTERPTATGALLKDTAQNISQLATASPTNEAIDNMLETLEYSSIRGHIVSEIQKEIERIIAQILKALLENSESLIKSAKETYVHQLKNEYIYTTQYTQKYTAKTKLLTRYWELLKDLGMTNTILNQFR